MTDLRDFLDEAKARLLLSQIIGAQVKLKPQGRGFVGLCPFHNEKTPSFTVDDGKGFYYCFGCGAHGDVVAYLQQQRGLDFAQVISELATLTGLEVPQRAPPSPATRARSDLRTLLAVAAQWYQAQLTTPQAARARNFLEERGISLDDAARLGLGYAGLGRAFVHEALTARGFPLEQQEAAGLVVRPAQDEVTGSIARDQSPTRGARDQSPTRDFFFDRLLFPICDRRGAVISFGGRRLGERGPKYINGRDTAVFEKRHMLYNFKAAQAWVRRSSPLVIVEGYLDVIAAERVEIAAVAPLGTALSKEQLALAWEIAAEPIVCFDSDTAGMRASVRSLDLALTQLAPGRSLRFARLPPGEDPDTVIRQQGRASFLKILEEARPLVDQLWLALKTQQGLDTPERCAACEEAIDLRLRALPHQRLRAWYRKALRQRLFEDTSGRRAASRVPRRGPSAYNRGAYSRGPSAYKGAYLTPAAPANLMKKRREELILATLLCYPALLLEQSELLAQVGMRDQHHERLCGIFLDCAAEKANQGQTLAPAHLAAALADKGLGRDLRILRSDALRRLGGLPTVAPEDPEALPLEGLRQDWLHWVGETALSATP